MKTILEEIGFLLAHLYERQEQGVKMWTNVECEDYQIPIALIIGFLSHAVPPMSYSHIPVRNRPEYLAMVDIIKKSHLSELLEVDASNERIAYRTAIPMSTKEEIARFVDSNSKAIAD